MLLLEGVFTPANTALTKLHPRRLEHEVHPTGLVHVVRRGVGVRQVAAVLSPGDRWVRTSVTETSPESPVRSKN